MPQLLPLRGLRYTAAAGPLDDLLAPPYDVITPAQQRALADRNPHNAVLLELAEGGDERYARVAGLLEQWQRDGILGRDGEPALYVYEQEFAEGGRTYTRRALIVGVEAQPWDEGAVRPHEFTMSGPKEDRLRLLEATRTQLSPVFMIARDRAGQLTGFIESTIAGGAPAASATSVEGDRHQLWVAPAGRFELRQLAPLLAESFYIADGHHRYETAVNYRRRLVEREGSVPKDHPARYAMTAVVAANDPGLVIRPIHRLVPKAAPADWRARVEPVFAVQELASDGAGELHAMDAQLAGEPSAIVALGLDRGAIHVLRLRDPGLLLAAIPAGHSERWAAIPPNVLRYGVLTALWNVSDDDLREGLVEYTHDPEEILAAVAGRPPITGFLLNPVGIEDVMALADQGERMPQKSTFFHPKLGTGMVFHPLYA